MTSTVRYFRYDDAGAPQLSGQVGSLTNILRKCLVGTSGIAYGSKPSAGWSEEFIGAAANIAVFRTNQAEGFSGCYVRINDNAPGTGGAREAYLNVYATMSDINTGTTGTRNYYIRKSATADATTRRWMLAADGGTAWLYVWLSGDNVNYGADGTIAGFGDYDSFHTSGAYRYYASARTSENYSNGASGDAFLLKVNADEKAQVAPPSGVGGVLSALISSPFLAAQNTAIGSSSFPASPNPMGNRNFMASPFVCASVGCVGRLRGIALPFERLYSVAQGDVVPGSSVLRVMRANYGGVVTDAGHVAIAVDTAGPW